MRRQVISLTLILIAALVLAWRLWDRGAFQASHTLLGYGEGDYVYVSPAIAGRLDTLSVDRGQEVKVGDPLALLENANEKAALTEAKSRLDKANSQYANLTKGKRPEEIAITKAQLKQAEVDLELYKITVKRQTFLVRTKAASQDALDRAVSQYDHGLARIDELKAQLEVDQLGGRIDDILAAQNEVNTAKALVDQAQWKVDQKSLPATVNGLVTDTLYRQGEWIAAGSPVVSILPDTHRFVRFFVPEELLGRLTIGQKTTISCNGCSNTIDAKITYISPTAEYTPPVLYSREWRSKLVFMIEATPIQPTRLIHPGQPVDVEIALP